MSQTSVSEHRALPVAPRPFADEILGGWIGRLAGRYRMSVSEFAAVHALELGLESGAGWLLIPALQPETLTRIAVLTRIEEARIAEVKAPVSWIIWRTHFVYCPRCVFLNPLDVTSPIVNDGRNPHLFDGEVADL
ncbi:TniQ family protein [Verminephrobacter eiseniae]